MLCDSVINLWYAGLCRIQSGTAALISGMFGRREVRIRKVKIIKLEGDVEISVM